MDAAVVWPSQDAAQAPADARRALDEWARARGLRLSPAADGPADVLPVDLAAADGVEVELERARDAIASLDADGATQALARAEAILRENVSLPQAAWLMAEVHRTRAARWTRLEPRDRDAAARAWREAAALDGGRMAGVGEEPRPADVAPVDGVLSIEDGDGLVVRVDGAVVAPGKLRLGAAQHHVVASRDGAPVWAAWIAWPPASGQLAIAVPPPPACSAGDLGRVRVEGDRVRASGVRCPRWVAAVATERPDTIHAALCDGASCGPLLEWRARSSFETPGAARTREAGGFPVWGWALAGVGAMAITGIVLVSAGAFDQPAPAEVRWVNGGVRTEGR